MDTLEYKLIQNFYGDRVAERSKQPLMKHIDEGLQILDSIGATENAKKAFCLHPIVQNSDDLGSNFGVLCNTSLHVIMLVMEYRNIANQYLSKRKIGRIDEIELSPLHEVNDMLIADKVQNYSDFLKYHFGTHERSDQLVKYFENWLSKLEARPVYEKFRETNR